MSKIKSFDGMAEFIIAENNKMTEKILNVKSEITCQISSITDSINKKFEDITKENNELRSRISEMDDLLSRRERRNQLIIRGVPVLTDENLKTVFNQISQSVKFDINSSNGYNIYRIIPKTSKDDTAKRMLRSKNNVAARQIVGSPIILVEFLAHWDKATFMNKYLMYIKQNELDASMLGLGLSSKSRIYIGESLTKRNQDIFIKCATFKSSGKIAQYFTRNGIVFVRKSKNSSPLAMWSLDTLHNELASSSITLN